MKTSIFKLVIAAIAFSFLQSCDSSSEADQQNEAVKNEPISSSKLPFESDLSDFVLKADVVDGKEVNTFWLENVDIPYDALMYYHKPTIETVQKGFAQTLEKLSAKSPENAPFNFRLLTDMLIKADGEMAEVASPYALAFLENNPNVFISFLLSDTPGKMQVFDAYKIYVVPELSAQGKKAGDWASKQITSCACPKGDIIWKALVQ